MAEYKDQMQLEAWLRERPREVAVAIAARAALRVLPLLALDFSILESGRSLLLLEFHAMALPWGVAKYPGNSNRFLYPFNPQAVSSGRDTTSAARAAYCAARVFAAAEDSDAAAAATAAVEMARGGIKWYNRRRYSDAVYNAAVSFDITKLESTSDKKVLVVRATNIASTRLWPVRTPQWVSQQWTELKAALLAIPDENWQVWTDWYDDRLAGRPANEAHELARALLPEKVWKQGPKVVNARIAEILAEKPKPPPQRLPKIPATRPAALEPEWLDGRLVLREGRRRPSRQTELAALRDQMVRLAKALDEEANIDPRVPAFLREVAERVPEKSPTQVQVFEIGHDLAAIQSYAATVTDEWPELLAQRYHGMALAYDRTMQKFPRWQAFVRNRPKDQLAKIHPAELAQAVANIGAELGTQDARQHIAPEISEALAHMARPFAEAANWRDEIAKGNALLLEDVLESTNNTLKRLAEYAVAGWGFVTGSFFGKASEKFAEKFKRTFVDESGQLGEATAKAGFKWVKRLLTGGALVKGTIWLIATFPQYFAWFEHVLKFLQ